MQNNILIGLAAESRAVRDILAEQYQAAQASIQSVDGSERSFAVAAED
jgi:hypothetical protein